MTTFAKRLRRYMDEANMKQSELVEKTKIHKSAISAYLAGTYEPKQRNIYKLATALGIKPSQLMGIGGPQIVKLPPEPRIELTPPECELIKKYRKLDGVAQDRVQKMVDFELFQQRQASQEDAQKDARSCG